MQLILGAIEALDDKNGASTEAISKHIESMYGELPAAHSTLLSHHLNKMKQTGELVMYKNNYLKPDPTRTSRRGRGRPPKAKVSPAGDVPVSPPRSRGRPKKAVESEAKKSGTRPRGRPRKNVEPKSEAKLSDPRPRGRPPKIVDPAGASSEIRPRGRPLKVKSVDQGALVPVKRRGRPAKIDSSATKTLSRPRGRPPKNSLAGPSRGRGRPKNAKAKAPVAPKSSTGPRGGRPLNDNAEDFEGPISLPVTNSPSLSGRKRGRPKKEKDASATQPGAKRGRGRPPKETSV